MLSGKSDQHVRLLLNHLVIAAILMHPACIVKSRNEVVGIGSRTSLVNPFATAYAGLVRITQIP